MALIGSPPNTNVDDTIGQGWAQFFNAVYNILFAITQSGTTANRPLKFLWIGRPYFDRSLGIPIWYSGTVWVNASGGIV